MLRDFFTLKYFKHETFITVVSYYIQGNGTTVLRDPVFFPALASEKLKFCIRVKYTKYNNNHRQTKLLKVP